MILFFSLLGAHILFWFVLGMLVCVLNYKGNSLQFSTATAMGLMSFVLHLLIKYINANWGWL